MPGAQERARTEKERDRFPAKQSPRPFLFLARIPPTAASWGRGTLNEHRLSPRTSSNYIKQRPRPKKIKAESPRLDRPWPGRPNIPGTPGTTPRPIPGGLKKKSKSQQFLPTAKGKKSGLGKIGRALWEWAPQYDFPEKVRTLPQAKKGPWERKEWRSFFPRQLDTAGFLPASQEEKPSFQKAVTSGTNQNTPQKRQTSCSAPGLNSAPGVPGRACSFPSLRGARRDPPSPRQPPCPAYLFPVSKTGKRTWASCRTGRLE